MSDQSLPSSRPYTGAEYIESLRDDRVVYAYGKRVDDVTTHPAFAEPVRAIAAMYDSLHDPNSGMTVVPTDTGSGGITHPFYKAPRSVQDLVDSRDAIAHWARMSYGWMGRTPDYKAAFLGTLATDEEFYDPYQENALRWYRESQERVLYWNHALVNPPVDRHLPLEEAGEVIVHVEKETDSGLIVSGAKVVATGAAMTHMTFLAHAGVPVKEKKFSLIAGVPMDAPGVKLVSRVSYTQTAHETASPFDYPLSSRFDENDPILILDRVLVPWENVFLYGALDRTFGAHPGFGSRLSLHGATRLAVKLDFILGLYVKALALTGVDGFRGVQTRLGEALAWRATIWSLVESMVKSPRPGPGGSMEPNTDGVNGYRWMGMQAYSRIREIILQDLGSALIYLPSSVKDFQSPEIRPYLDTYVRGSAGVESVERVKTLKMLWDAVGTEFGGRHELYERNYQGNHEMVRIFAMNSARAEGQIDDMVGLAEQALATYDLDGWTLPSGV